MDFRKVNMFKGLFTFEDSIDGCDSFQCFGGVKFLKDFGPFKQGDELEALNVDFDTCVMQEQYENGDDKERKCSFKLVLVE